MTQATQLPPSMRHSNVAPGSEVKLNAPVVELDTVGGAAVMVVSGALASTVHVRKAGEASTLPTASVARTFSVCEPSARPEKDSDAEHAAHAPASSWHS